MYRLIVCAMIVCALSGPAQAQPGASTTSDVQYGSVDSATLRIFAIGTVGIETVPHGMHNLSVAVPQAGHGSGFGVGRGGMVVTAAHVVKGAAHVVVRLPGEGGFVRARVAYHSEADDIAILHVPGRIPVLTLAGEIERLRVRQTVYAIGYPIDPSRTHPQSAKGIVAGTREDGLLQLDMALNPGNSGGPLVDEKNQVIGMIVARGNMSAGIQGIGYAVGKRKIDKALAAARNRLRAGAVKELTPSQERSAGVVDELLQRGALPGLDGTAQIGRPLTRAEIRENLDSWIGNIEDPDLLAFVSGNLWNAYLALKFGAVRQLGGTVLTDTQARGLAKQLRKYAIQSSQRAAARDSSIKARSPFVQHVVSGRGADESINKYATAEGISLDPFRRVRLSASVGYNRGPVVAAGRSDIVYGGFNARAELLVPFMSLDAHKRRHLVAQLGVARGYGVSGGFGEGSHDYTSYELGMGLVNRVGDEQSIGAFLSWAPGTLRIRDGVAGDSDEFSIHNARIALMFVGRFWTFGAGMRVVSGSGWWAEWLSVGFVL